MTAVTPGQAACVAWNEHYAEEHGIKARNEWAASDPRGRSAWEAAASAAITAGAPAELENQVARGDRLEGQNENLRQAIDELLDCTGLDDGEQAEWRERAGLPA